MTNPNVRNIDGLPAIMRQFDTFARTTTVRAMADAGITVVDGSFEKGATGVTKGTGVYQESTGKVFQWQLTNTFNITAGTLPTDYGTVGTAWIDKSSVTLKSLLVQTNALSSGLIGGLWRHAKAGDVDDFLLKVKAASDAGGGVVVWPAATVYTDGFSIGNNINDALGYFGLNSISNVTIYAHGVKLVPLTEGSSVNAGELVNLVDATDCVIYGFEVDGETNTNTSSRLGMRMAGCVRCHWNYPIVKNAGNYSLIVSGAQFGIGTCDSRNCTVNYGYALNQRYWTGNSAAQIIAANGAQFTEFNWCVSENNIGTAGIDLFDDDNAPHTHFNCCTAIGTVATGACFWLEGSEQVAPSYRTKCHAYSGATGFGSSESRYTTDTDCVSYGVIGRALWSRNAQDRFVGCRYIDGGSLDIEKGAELHNCSQDLISGSTRGNVNVYDAAGNNSGIVKLFGGVFGDIYVHDTAVTAVELHGSDVNSIQTYNSTSTKIVQYGGRCRNPSLINRGHWRSFDTDFQTIVGATAIVRASLDSADVEIHRGKYKDLTVNVYSGAGFSHLKIRDSIYNNCPNSVDTNQVKLASTTPAQCYELSHRRGMFLARIQEKNISDGYPTALIGFAAHSSGSVRKYNVLLAQAGASGTTVTITWEVSAAPMISKSASDYDGIYNVSIL